MAVPIVDLRPDNEDLVDQAAVLLQNAFRKRTEDWQDAESARQEVLEPFAPQRISRVFLDESRTVLGWICAIPTYASRVWEIHPLVVSESHRRRGVGRSLVEDLEQLVASRGALTLWVGSDDENAYFDAFDWVAQETGTYTLQVTSFEAVSIGQLIVAQG